MTAFTAAAHISRCDGFESDVQLSSDGEPVIIHDSNLARTTSGTGMVGDHTYKSLRELDCGSWKGTEFAGERMPHLDELLEFVKKYGLLLNLEIKNYDVFYKDIEQTVIGCIKNAGLEDKVFLSSFNHVSMQSCRKLTDTIACGLLYGYPLIDIAEYASRAGMNSIHPAFTCISYQPHIVKDAHQRKLGVHTWTVNSEDNMETCIQLDVDSIITNYPDLLASILETKEAKGAGS